MAGDIKAKWSATTVTVTTTNLVTACTHTATWLTGWTSSSYANTGGNLDYLYSGQFTLAAASASAGQITVYVVSSLNDTPAWTAVSSGTLGTESATPVVFADTQRRDAIARPLLTIAVSATNGGIFTFPQTGIAMLFGGTVPTHHCLWVTANCNTSTNANFQATCAIYQEPSIGQYT